MNGSNQLVQKLRTFMQGRYGIDQLYRALLIAWLAFTLLSSIIGHAFRSPWLSMLMMGLSVAAAVWMIYRALSRDISKRAAENMKYLEIEGAVRKELRLISARVRDRKTSRYRRCPGCHTAVRVKNIKGEHNVRCPVCGDTFHINIRL